MRNVSYRLIWMFAMFCMFAVGIQMQTRYQEFTRVETHRVVLVDAYDKYSENGTPTFVGIFKSEKYNARFEHAIEPKTYREFIASGSQERPMLVKKSREDMNDPKSPSGGIALSIMLASLAVVVFFWHFICLLVFRNEYRY